MEESDWPAVSIYRHRKHGHLLVQAMCRRGLAQSEIGEPVVVDARSSDSGIADAVLEGLASYSPTFDPDRARRLTTEADATFCRQHDLVIIVMKDSVLDLRPAEHVRGGFQGISDAQIVLATNEARERLPRAIREAFERAR